MDTCDIEKINGVWIFKNVLKNGKDLIEYFEKNREWQDWYLFGTNASVSEHNCQFPSFPNVEDFKKQISGYHADRNKTESDIYFENQINNLFYDVTKLYVEENNIELDDWVYAGWNIAMYSQQEDASYNMSYHTDYQRELEHIPGVKFGVTAVFYLNDGYSGGDINFKIFGDKDLQTIEKEFSYSPKEGDVMVFPSKHPYYHGVDATTKGNKYIIRTYWRYNSPGSDKWLEMQDKYGKEKWQEMEDERVTFIKKRKNARIINQIPTIISFEEYYDKLEKVSRMENQNG
jgi:hypothetical protein